MRKLFVAIPLTLLLLSPFTRTAKTWGFYAHKKINRMAVFTLPPELISFYKAHINYISEHAVDADKRRYAVKNEAAKHYIDIDHYGTSPFDSVPVNWKDAIKKFSEDSLRAYGILPWHISTMCYRLQQSFVNQNLQSILKNSADIGHYIADACVPLHTTMNYNGQYTNQKGIHGFWESRIPELSADGYSYWTGRATYVERPIDMAWKLIKSSHMAVDSVLQFEALLNQKFKSDQKYSFESRGRQTVKVYSKNYSLQYEKMLNGMIEKRMRLAIKHIGNIWYTAWVNAGKPNLKSLNTQSYPKEEGAPTDSSSAVNNPHLKGHLD